MIITKFQTPKHANLQSSFVDCLFILAIERFKKHLQVTQLNPKFHQ